MYSAQKGEFGVPPTVHRNPETTGCRARNTVPTVGNSKRQFMETIARAQGTGYFEEKEDFGESFSDSRAVFTASPARQCGSGNFGFVLETDIRSRHSAILRLSDDVLGEIQLDELATDALGPATQVRSADRDRSHRSRAPISLGSPLIDSSSSLEGDLLDDGRFTNERRETPTCVSEGSKPLGKYDDVSKCSKRPTTFGNTLSSNWETSINQDRHKTEAYTDDWEGTFSKNASSVLDLLPKGLEKYSDEAASPRQIQSGNFTKDYSTFSEFPPNESQSFQLGQFSGKSFTVKDEIPDDIKVSKVIQNIQEENKFSTKNPLSLSDLVPDLPKDIINICWRYQDLDDRQLERMRHYMIAKAFGAQRKVLQESIP